MCTVSISSTTLTVEPFLFFSFTLCLALAAASYGRRGANRHWRVAGNREKNQETPFGGLHVQIWGRTQVERGLLADLIHTGGGQLLSQQSQDHDVRRFSYRRSIVVDNYPPSPTQLLGGLI